MKILHVITSLQTGGAEKLMVDLLPRLKSYGHDVDLLLFDGIVTPFRREVEAAGIKVFDLGKGGSVYSPLKLLRLMPFLKRYDVMHTHNTAPQLFAALGSFLSGAVFFTTEHNTTNRRRNLWWFAPIDKWMYSRYRKIICISKKTEDNLRAYLGKCRADILTCNNGIDVSKYANAAPSIELERIAPNKRKIIMVAGFREQKDQDSLIKAMRYLPDKFHLFLVGDGDRRSEIEKLISKERMSHRIHLLGIRMDIPQLLHAADYVVMSSNWEGFGLAAVEGMAAGKPVIASDVDGLREVVSGAGLLFYPKDSIILSKNIMDLENDTDYYEAVAKACYNRALQYDIFTMAKNYSNIYTT